MLDLIKSCPICDDILTRVLCCLEKRKYICSNNAGHIFYLEANEQNQIENVYAIINKSGISWNVVNEQSLTLLFLIDNNTVQKVSLNYFDPNLFDFKYQFLSILEKHKIAKILL
jgi:hypothetical protein